ncbi:MAG TPA: YggS family pyridoxal phosphate enzyme [Solirubrobacterales bacterium]|jgi:PLP dependent protein|nr:YggS family pyridoxal phosphate enzyme [Solirubrobacterales bacterium]
MVEPFRDIDPGRVADKLTAIRAELPAGTEVLVACKYVPSAEMGALAEAGVGLVGENRLNDLVEKQERWRDAFTWDFIGNLQSRKVRDVLPRVRLIHSVHTDSVMRQLGKHGDDSTEVLIQVNVAGEEGKGGVDPAALGTAIDACPVRVVGLSTMPPFSDDPEASRPHFARLAELASEHGLSRLSMGTTQDWRVAVEEGATTIRIGSILFD